MQIPEDNLAYPILITLHGGGTGSGFLVRSDKFQYFITAKHVIFQEDQNLRSISAEIVCLSPKKTDDRTSTFKLNFNIQLPRCHKSADVCAFKFSDTVKPIPGTSRYEFKTDSSVEILNVNPFGMVSANLATTIKMFDQVEVSNSVYLYGYPTSLGLKRIPKLFDYSKPLLRKGIVANVFPDEKTIILDCAVFYGNSGGPVVQEFPEGGMIKHYIIGLVSKYIPFVQEWENRRERIINEEFTNSGYSVITSMDRVVELIQSME